MSSMTEKLIIAQMNAYTNIFLKKNISRLLMRMMLIGQNGNKR